MATIINITSGENFTNRSFVFVKYDNNRNIVTCNLGEDAIGILQDASPRIGEGAPVALEGVCKVKLGSSAVPGDLMSVGADGVAVVNSLGYKFIGAKALQAGISGDIIDCEFVGSIVKSRGQILPSGVVIDYVNRCDFIMQEDGLLITSFDSTVTAYRNIAGGFNGGGRGNKEFVSFNNFNGISFGNLTSLKLVAKNFNGATNLVALNLQVDLAGNGNVADVAILIPKVSNLFITGPTNTEQSVASSGNVWAAVGGTGAPGGTAAAGKAGIPPYVDQSGASFCSLAHIMQYNTNAKLWNGALLDGGQPKSASLGSIQVIMGSSGTEVYSRNSLYSTTVGISGSETLYYFGI